MPRVDTRPLRVLVADDEHDTGLTLMTILEEVVRCAPRPSEHLTSRAMRSSGLTQSTLEVIVTESPAHLQREHDPHSGLALIRIG